MSEQKRKTKTSTAVKKRYNEKVYSSLSVKIPKEMFSAFKEKCIEQNISQAGFIKKAIQEFLDE